MRKSLDVVAAVIAYLLVLAAIVGGVAYTSQARAEQHAAAAAQASLDAWVDGRYGDYYDTLSPEVRRILTRRQYVALVTPCPCSSPTAYLVTGVDLESNGVARVHTTQGGHPSITVEMRYADGRWSYQPDPADMAFLHRIGSGELTLAKAEAELSASRAESCV